MKKCLFVNAICLLFCLTSHAQQIIIWQNRDTIALRQLDLGDSLFKIGENKMAIEEYRKQVIALEKYRKEFGDASPFVDYNFARAFACDNQSDSAFKYLYENMKYDSSAEVLGDPDFLSLRKDKRWEEFKNKLVSEIVTANHGQIKDIELAKKLWDMHAWDQAYYYEIDIVEKKIGMHSPVGAVFWDLKGKINLENQHELDSIIAVKGWPKISQVGAEAAQNAFLIIQHSDLTKQEKYLPEIKKLCEQHEADWPNYALMYDRIQINENKPQLYGSQLKFNDATKKYELYPIEDEKNVDKRRSEMGLGTLANYAAMWGITYIPKQ